MSRAKAHPLKGKIVIYPSSYFSNLNPWSAYILGRREYIRMRAWAGPGLGRMELDQLAMPAASVTHTPRYSMQCREGVKSVGLLLPSNDSINKRDRSERRLTSRPLKLLGQQCRLCSAGSEPGSGLWLLLLYVFVVWD